MDRIRQLRKDRGLSQAKLAVMADMDPATLNRLERGTGNPNLKTLERVADALEVGVADLLPKALRRSSLEPTLNDVLEDERHPPFVAEAVAAVAEKWQEAASNPTASLREINTAVEAALALGEALIGQLDKPSAAGYSAEKREAIRLAARLVEISQAANERILDSGQEEHASQRREQIKEMTRRISA